MVEVRRARTGDDAELATLDRATWSVDVSPSPPPAAGTPFFQKGCQPEDVLVVDVDGLVAGYVKLHQAIPLPAHAHVLEVNGLAVDPDKRGQGIGRVLVDAVKREARSRGASKLTLRVLAPNTTARRLYDAAGFTVEGVLRGEFLLDGVLVDDILMACPLTSSSTSW